MYLDLAGLARYKRDFGAWARGALLPKDAAAARVRTAKAGAVSLVPVQETPLDVSVDFLFSETDPASGDKGPDNPSTITGKESVKATRCGKNLCTFPYEGGTYTGQDITVTPSSDGAITINGTATSNRYYVFTSNIPLHAGTKIVMSATEVSGTASKSLALQFNNGNGIKWQYLSNNTTVYTVETDGVAWFRLYIGNGTICTNYTIKPQYEIGETVTAYEKYDGADYVIDLGSTFYGGTLDVATGVMTVTWVGIVYDGTEAITKQSDLGDGTPQYNLPVPSLRQSGENLQSGTHFPTGYTANRGYVRTSGGTGYRVYPVGYDTLESFVAWVASQYAAGTPVTIAYKTATPYAVQLTPTEILSLTQSSDYDSRVNTIYTDASAVQVGYLKHPSAASSDLRNAAVSLGGGV